MVCVEFSWPSVFSSSEWSRYVCEAATFVFTTQIALVESVALRCFRIEHYALHIQTHNFSNTSFSLKVPPPAAGLLHRRGATVVARKVGTGLEGSGASTRLRKKYEVPGEDPTAWSYGYLGYMSINADDFGNKAATASQKMAAITDVHKSLGLPKRAPMRFPRAPKRSPREP